MIAGRASATALLVALSVMREGVRHHLPAASIAMANAALGSARGIWRGLGWLARHAAGRAALRSFESFVLPGLATHHCQRKGQLWQHLLARPQGGRIIWLGVGFDALGRALQSHRPDIACVETDHPDTLAMRRLLIDDPHRRTEALQLPSDAEHLLHLCRSAPTTLIAEGLLMYLPPRPLLRLLRQLSRLPTPPHLLFSALEPTRLGGRGFARAQPIGERWLLRQGEPFRWRTSPQGLMRVLQHAGYGAELMWDGAGFGEYLITASPASRVTAPTKTHPHRETPESVRDDCARPVPTA